MTADQSKARRQSTGAALPQKTKQNIRVEGPFVSLVHDDAAVHVKVGFTKTLAKEDTICHVLDHSLVGSAIFKPEKKNKKCKFSGESF